MCCAVIDVIVHSFLALASVAAADTLTMKFAQCRLVVYVVVLVIVCCFDVHSLCCAVVDVAGVYSFIALVCVADADTLTMKLHNAGLLSVMLR